jgi:TPP-dependent pyruvate/acetoin dehydrogenase alpha subunit
LILNTYRFAAHSKGDDTRTQPELDAIRRHDPLLVHGARLSGKERQEIEVSINERILTTFQKAESDPPASAIGA